MSDHIGPPVQVVMNTRVDRAQPYGPAELNILGGTRFTDAERTITSWPGYAPTPILTLSALANRAAIAAVYYKNEGERFGLGSFKTLGGAYAVSRVVERLRQEGTRDLSGVTVTCATDGNHGRSVAWGAQRAGCRSVIFVHANVSRARVEAMERYGAEVRCVEGNYDDSVRRAALEAAHNGWHVVSDTSYDGYAEIACDVMQGYAMIMHEAEQQLAGLRPPTHVFVQAGVGGLAAAVGAYLWEHKGAARPRLIVVEARAADCLLRSCVAGERSLVAGELDTIMAGLACGEPSLLAWDLLRKCADAFMSIRDEDAVACMRLLAHGGAGQHIVGGESGVAGLAGFLAAAGHLESRDALEIDSNSVVLTIGTEGATDPELYARLVGSRDHLSS